MRCPRCGYALIKYGQFLCSPCSKKARRAEELAQP